MLHRVGISDTPKIIIADLLLEKETANIVINNKEYFRRLDSNNNMNGTTDNTQKMEFALFSKPWEFKLS